MLSRLCPISWARLGRKCFIAFAAQKMPTEAFKEPRGGRGESQAPVTLKMIRDLLGDLSQDVAHLAGPGADHDGFPRLQ